MKMRKWSRYSEFAMSGDWQLHTNTTDGKSSIKEVFEQAVSNDLKFLHFSEHVRKELSYDYFKFKEEVYRIGEAYPIRFVVGAEAKVLDVYGNLDIDEAVAREAELITFSFHSPYFKTKNDYITAICAAAKNSVADIWGHPTSYHNWLEFEMTAEDWEIIASELKSANVLYELNKRYPPPDKTELGIMIKRGVPIIFSSDAHHFSELMTKEDKLQFDELVKRAQD